MDRRRDQPLMEAPTSLNFSDAFLPSAVTAAMHTTAISATSSAYSTSDAPRSLLMCAVSQADRNWNCVTIGWTPFELDLGPDGPGLPSPRCIVGISHRLEREVTSG